MYFTFHFDQFSLKTLQQQSSPVLSVPSSVVNDEVAVASRCYSLDWTVWPVGFSAGNIF